MYASGSPAGLSHAGPQAAVHSYGIRAPDLRDPGFNQPVLPLPMQVAGFTVYSTTPSLKCSRGKL